MLDLIKMRIEDIKHKLILKAIERHEIDNDTLLTFNDRSELSHYILNLNKMNWYRKNKDKFKDNYEIKYKSSMKEKYEISKLFKELPNF
jgi:hypothetical protein